MNITIAGASGFIGGHLIPKLIDKKYSIRCLSRRAHQSKEANFSWIEADLFSLTSTIEALKGTDVAIYLVHSMMPSSRLFQGKFQDTDLLLADNFARACIKANVKQIIYLGGLVPVSGSSKHLSSRKEVEKVLKSTNIPVTVLRAGMVVGDGGSSFEILKNLVLNLPAMALPKWTKSKTQVIYIDDLIDVLVESISNNNFLNKTINVINGEQLTYKELIEETIEYLDKKKILIPIPINYTTFSKHWVKHFGEADIELVSPLIDSLLCDLPSPEIDILIKDLIKFRTYKEMLKKVSITKTIKMKKSSASIDNVVRSIQRLPNSNHLTNERLYKKYIEWLPKNFNFIINAKEESNDIVNFYLFNIEYPLLSLKKIEENENIDRVKLHIVGGLLTKTTDTGWLEFRQVNNGEFTLSSIHGFVPALPWYIYRYTQAPLHEYVMNRFGRFIAKI
jgi:uncharacterized protein YbjT (DUF2867 family)